MSAAYEIAKVAVPAAAVALVAGTFVVSMRRADKKPAEDKSHRGSAAGSFGFIPADYGSGQPCDHGGHGHHGGHHGGGDCGGHHGGDGGGHDGGGGGHH